VLPLWLRIKRCMYGVRSSFGPKKIESIFCVQDCSGSCSWVVHPAHLVLQAVSFTFDLIFCPSLWRNRLEALTADQRFISSLFLSVASLIADQKVHGWRSIPIRAKWGHFLRNKIVLVVQSTPPSTGTLVSVQYDQPPLIYFGVCGRQAITKPTNIWFVC
jgi:hypothetical protein